MPPFLYIRVAALLCFCARMGDSAMTSRSDILRVPPQRARTNRDFASAPAFATALELCGAQFNIDAALFRIDGDDVAFTKQRNRPSVGCLRSDMSDTQARA